MQQHPFHMTNTVNAFGPMKLPTQNRLIPSQQAILLQQVGINHLRPKSPKRIKAVQTMNGAARAVMSDRLVKLPVSPKLRRPI